MGTVGKVARLRSAGVQGQGHRGTFGWMKRGQSGNWPLFQIKKDEYYGVTLLKTRIHFESRRTVAWNSSSGRRLPLGSCWPLKSTVETSEMLRP